MMQNRKGFTLIELLAVIVILAIIALITTPTILNVMENSRRDAAKDKAYGTIQAVQLAYTQAQVSYEVNMPYTVDFSKNEAGTSEGTTGYTHVAGQEVQASGEMPTAGKITIGTNGQIYIATEDVNNSAALKFGNYYCYDLGADQNHEVACARRS